MFIAFSNKKNVTELLRVSLADQPLLDVPLVALDGATLSDETARVVRPQGIAIAGDQTSVKPIPAGVDLKNYPSVVIWCEQFGVLISPADLRAAN